MQTLHPGGVSTNLNGYRKPEGDCVHPDDCAGGSLADLGANTMSIFGAKAHTTIGRITLPMMAWSPDINKYMGNKRKDEPAFRGND